MELILIIGLVVLVGIVVFIIITHQYSDSEDAKERRAFVKFMKAMKIKSNGKYYKYALQLDKTVHSRIMKCFTIARELLMTLDNPLEASVYIASAKNNSNDKPVLQDMDFDKFFYCFRLIRNVDAFFDEKKMMEAYSICKTDKKDILEPFARAWVDQKNADLQIDFETAKEFVSKGRDFPLFVNLDIMAKRSEIEIDEKNIINDIDDNGLKIIIYSLIRAKYEGIYMSEEESCKINKANVLEYNDTFKITVELLKSLYVLKRDVNRFTNTMIKAHTAGVKINFSMTDLYSLSDDQFDILVSNIIKASDKGISIDQKDLIRQNIQGNDIAQLVKALIKANEFGLDLTPDELMNYMNNTHCDVVKFVKAYNFAVKHNLPSEEGTPLSKDHLVEYSRPNADLFDYVQGLQKAIDIKAMVVEARKSGGSDGLVTDLGITYPNLKRHFMKFGSVLGAIGATIDAYQQGLQMSFPLASAICASEEFDLDSAIYWAQTPEVMTVKPEITCLSKDGVQVTPKINVTVRGKLELIFAGYDLDVLFKRINEAVTMEFGLASDYEQIMKTLPQISQNVLNRINEEDKQKEIKTKYVREKELNEISRYELLDVNIYDLVIGQNVKAELEFRQAQIDSEIRRLKAEADRAKAEADIRIAMVQQYKDGTKPNFNELHKANLLDDKRAEILSGYES